MMSLNTETIMIKLFDGKKKYELPHRKYFQ